MLIDSAGVRERWPGSRLEVLSGDLRGFIFAVHGNELLVRLLIGKIIIIVISCVYKGF